MLSLLGSIDEEKANYRYAEGKWSIKELLGHLTDTERVFAYRALTSPVTIQLRFPESIEFLGTVCKPWRRTFSPSRRCVRKRPTVDDSPIP